MSNINTDSYKLITEIDPYFIDLLYKLYYPFLLQYKNIKQIPYRYIIYSETNNEICGYLMIGKFLEIALIPKYRGKIPLVNIIKNQMKIHNLNKIIYVVNKQNYPSLKLLKKLEGGIFNENDDVYYGHFYYDKSVTSNQRSYLDDAIDKSKKLYSEWLKSFNKRKKILKELNKYILLSKNDSSITMESTIDNNTDNINNNTQPLLTEDEIQELLSSLPKLPLDDVLLEGSIIDTEKFIKFHECKPVTSYFIYKPGTSEFHENGLFSETIFGNTISLDRFKKFGYISLNTEIIQPVIYFILSQLKKLYIQILSGSTYAIFNSKTKDFELSNNENPNANTGFSFFIKHIYDLIPPKSESQKKEGYRRIFLKYQRKKLLTTKYLLVLPAGLREISEDTKKLSRDSINQMYLNVLSLSNGIDPNLKDITIYDNLRFMIQSKIIDIWNYILNIIKGDNGYVLDKFGDRVVAFGTGNVLSIDIKRASSPDDPTNLANNEVSLSASQSIKAYQPIIIHALKDFFTKFINENTGNSILSIYNQDTNNIKTVEVTLPNKIINKYIDYQKLEYFINSYQYPVFQKSPVKIKYKDQDYYFFFIYDLDKIIYFFKNLDDLKKLLSNQNIEFNKDNIRPMLWIDLMYTLCLFNIEQPSDGIKNAGQTTRYPVIQQESIRPLHPKVIFTFPYRNVVAYYIESISEYYKLNFYKYPIINAKIYNSMSVNSLTMEQYGADTDGDILSYIGLYTIEARKELEYFNQSINSIITNDGNMQYIPKPTHKIIVKILTS